jgi:hypothetical protein
MATNAPATRTARIRTLEGSEAGWELLWAEYQSARAESEGFRSGVVQGVETKIALALSRCPPLDGATAAGRAADAARSALLWQVVPDYDEVHFLDGALVDQACALHQALLLMPAPDEAALAWKIGQVAAAGIACRETRDAIMADSRRLRVEHDGRASD